jgi:uncharacterized protein
MFKQSVSELISKQLKESKLLVVQGPKSSNRTQTIINSLPINASYLVFNVENKKVKKEIEILTDINIQSYFDESGFIILKEPQNLKNLPFIMDWFLNTELELNMILICSFLPILENELIEALKHNNLILTCHTPSFHEIASNIGLPNLEKNIEERLIYGNYLDVIEKPENAIDFLKLKVEKIISDQINSSDRINKKENLLKLLQYISFHIGEHLTYNEIGVKCGLDNETVERYIKLLSQSFVLIQLPVFFNDQKYELKKAFTYYFYDNGIRNSFINNFNPIDLRIDANELWKNWLISEKLKNEVEFSNSSKYYFWITHTKQTVDLIQITPSAEHKAFQFQYNKKDKIKIPKSFSSTYPNIKTTIVNRSTYWTFLKK